MTIIIDYRDVPFLRVFHSPGIVNECQERRFQQLHNDQRSFNLDNGYAVYSESKRLAIKLYYRNISMDFNNSPWERHSALIDGIECNIVSC